jgi:DNA adenine methylase
MKSKSPLRYPGGKTLAIPDLLLFFLAGLDVLVSPCLGGGSFELAALVQGLVNRVIGYDAHYPLVAFWNRLLRSPGLVANKASLLHSKFGKDVFYSLRNRFEELNDSVDRAATYFALNRSSVNGLTFSGGYSPGHDRFTPSSIERLASFVQPRLSVAHADFRVSIPSHANEMLFLDPPYVRASTNLYGKKGHLHKSFKHQSLCDLLHQRDKWILTYDDSPEVKELYNGYRMVSRQWAAGMNKTGSFQHLIIISNDVVLPSAAEKWDWQV